MNLQLQTVLDFIQQNENIKAEEKDALIKALKKADTDFSIAEFKLERTEKVKRTTAILLEETIEELEQKRKAVEAQNKELEIETALERVRTVAMGMMKPDDLLEISKIQFNELKKLGFNEIRNALIGIFHDDENFFGDYDYSDFSGGAITQIPYHKNKVVDDAVSRMKSYNDAFTEFVVEGKELEEWKAFRKENGEYDDTRITNAEQLYYYFYSIESGSIGISTFKKISEEQLNILRRFRNVFDLAYKRYADISNAAAQAREAQIETSLERVRSRSMAMHHTAELQAVIHTVHKELLNLNIAVNGGSFITINSDIKTTLRCWGSGGTADTSEEVHLPLYEKPFCINLINGIKNGPGFFTEEYTQEEKKDFFTFLFQYKPWIDLDAKQKKETLSSPGGYTRSCCVCQHTSIFIINQFGEKFSAADNDILKRFAKVFEQTYIRFLDLQKAEAQAREAMIEMSLEKVRSRSMGMQKSDELKDVIKIVYQQLNHLKIKLDHAGFVVDYNQKGDWHFWIADEQDIPSKITHPYFESVWASQFNEAKGKGADFFATNLNFEEKNKFYNELLSYVPGLPEASKDFYLSCPGLAATTVLFDNVSLYIENFSGIPYSDEENTILMRFGKVFEQSYTRFLDLQKAEAQAREAQIEAALERTRTQSMIMQHSNELNDTLKVFHEQVLQLNIPSAFSFLWLPDEEKNKHIFWAIWEENIKDAIAFKDKAINYPLDRNEPATAQCLIDWKSGEPVYSYPVPPEGVENYFTTWQELIDGVEKLKPEFFPVGLHYVEAFMKYGCFGVMVENDLSEVDKKILNRLAIEFERTYTRFLDLQKAEAQARESQIEVALEKIRSRSLAMHSSGELKEVISIMFEKSNELNVLMGTVGIWLFNESTMNSIFWVGNDLQQPTMVNLPYDEQLMQEDSNYRDSWQAWISGEGYINKAYTFEQKNKYFNYVFANNNFDAIPAAVREVILKAPDHIACLVVEKNSSLFFDSWNGQAYSDANIDLLKRFAKVFEQAYVRFLDLQKAEAQARESQIELSLERVRAKTMAMHNSNDVGETVAVMVDELKKLGVETIRCGIGIMHHPGDMELWTITTENDKTTMIIGWLDMNIHPLLHGAVESWLNKNETFYYELKGGDLLNYFNAINHYPGYPFHFDTNDLPSLIHHNQFYFAEGTLFAFSLERLSEEQRKIFSRFAKVFGQTYRRYMDLQRAEIQAREAQIETGLEKVRSRTLAMQKSDELADTSIVIFEQLINLGIEPNRLFIGIINDKTQNIEAWATNEDGTKIGNQFTLNTDRNETVKKMFEGWNDKKTSITIDMTGTELQNYFLYLADEIQIPFKGGLSQKRRVQTIAYFGQGLIGMASPEEQPKSTTQLLERFAAVFNLTYTRFNDLKIAEAHALQAEQDLIAIKEAKQKAEEAFTELQATQKQLIQSEKMASLGELTAGIAHEIQNPLNFVNNFSEVSKELLDEMKEEMAKGNMEDANQIMQDIIQNLEKINHHGRRADAIVKGMLQHSRSSSGAKEATDINSLCDEYLRLSYHGLRAKDKSFNATIKTDFDESIGKINIIPQDMGRVILNLINNAFYAVDEKKKAAKEVTPFQKVSPLYEPTVSINTKKLGDKVLISVTDNGNGIPQNIVDKIFQPFFTTKPTGQGTGLGLSLSYDIVKAHGGEIKVETKEVEGTTFIIQLPV